MVVSTFSYNFIFALRNADKTVLFTNRVAEMPRYVEEPYPTRLFSACQDQKLETVKCLLKNGADPDRGNADLTPLMIAAATGNTDVAIELLNYGANVDSKKYNGETALHFAIYKCHLEMIHLLLEKNANALIINEEGFAALALAVKKERIDIVEILLDHNVGDPGKPVRGEHNVLCLAICLGLSDIVKLLLAHNVCDIRDGKALTRAVQTNRINTVKTLLAHNASFSWEDKNIRTEFLKAVEHGEVKMVKLLIFNGANIEIKNTDGNTPLAIACIKKHPSMVKLLCEKNACIDAINKIYNKYTPLHWAVEAKSLEVVEILLEYSPKLMKNESGQTALDIAKKLNLEDIKLQIEQFQERRMQQQPKSSMADYVSVVKDDLEKKKYLIENLLLKLGRHQSKIADQQECDSGNNHDDQPWREVNQDLAKAHALQTFNTDPCNLDLGHQCLLAIAKVIGDKWEVLGKQLDVAADELDRIKEDNPDDSFFAPWSMLVRWKHKETQLSEEEKKSHLKDKVLRLGIQDLPPWLQK